MIFSHRAMHWGSRGRADCKIPRVSFSFGCSDPSFEAPYLQYPERHLPFPKLAVRAALAAAQLINYHERFEFGFSLLRKLGQVFRSQRHHFTAYYVQKTTAELKAAVEDRQRQQESAHDKLLEPGSDEDEEAMDDALEAMLDAQMASRENLFDDFAELVGDGKL